MKRILLSALLFTTSAQLMASETAADHHHATVAAAALPAGFDPVAYVALYPDLQDYVRANQDYVASVGGVNQWAVSHYLTHGRNEGRNFQNVAAAEIRQREIAALQAQWQADVDRNDAAHAAYAADGDRAVTAQANADNAGGAAAAHYLKKVSDAEAIFGPSHTWI